MRYLNLCAFALLPVLGFAQAQKNKATKQAPKPVQMDRDSVISAAEAATSAGHWDSATAAYAKAIWLRDEKGTRLAKANVYLLQGDTAQYCKYVPTYGDERVAEKTFFDAHCIREDSVPMAATGLDTVAFPHSVSAKTTWHRSSNATHYKLYSAADEVVVSVSISATDTVYGDMDELPGFPEGKAALFKYLGAKVRYPELAQDSGIQGAVYIHFIVGKDGAVQDVSVMRGVHYTLDEESLRVVRGMPTWKPGIYNGKPVRTSFNLPIRFTLR
jgi:TonB family protein